MISVITCSQKPPSWFVHERHIHETIGTDHEYIRFDNSTAGTGICAAYNHCVARACGEIVVFIHDDVFVVTPSWGVILAEKFRSRLNTMLIGVAGTQLLLKENPFWPAAGRPFIHGKVVHAIEDEKRYVLSVYSHEAMDVEAVAVDGLFFAVRAALFKRVRFDQETFDHFHFYDLDICMQVRSYGDIIVTPDLLVKHNSSGAFNETWKLYRDRFVVKYRHALPAMINGIGEMPPKRIPGESIPLELVAPPDILDDIHKIGEKP